MQKQRNEWQYLLQDVTIWLFIAAEDRQRQAMEKSHGDRRCKF